MAPRPRAHSDNELLDAFDEYLAEHPSAQWSLADVAASIGVHSATLIKRFGSKRDLMLSLTRRWVGELSDPNPATTPEQTLLHYVSWGGRGSGKRQAAANLALIGDDMSDPERRALVARGLTAQEAILAASILALKADGRLPHAPNSDAAASILIDVVNGGQLRSAIDPATDCGAAETLLASWGWSSR